MNGDALGLNAKENFVLFDLARFHTEILMKCQINLYSDCAQLMHQLYALSLCRLVASPSEVPEEKPRGFVVPGEKIRNPHDAILSSAPPEGCRFPACPSA